MKRIATLIDFTPTCDVSLSYTIHIAKSVGAGIVLVYIASDEEDKKQALDKLREYVNKVQENNLECSMHVETGAFNSIIDTSLDLLGPELAVAGTHGVQGLKQTLFGANILKLAQNVSTPLLVVQDTSILNDGGLKNILLTLSSHTNFEPKIEYIAKLAKTLGSKVSIYTIIKSAFNLTDELNHNINHAKRLFDQQDIAYEHIIEDSHDHSVGYSRQTIHYLEKNPFDIVIMADELSKQSTGFSKADKENIILNEPGVPVLCI